MIRIGPLRSALALALFGALSAAAACGGGEEEEPEGCAKNCPFDYASWDGSQSVSFETDVFPIFRRSCGVSSSCHGSMAKPAAGMYIGPSLKNSENLPTDSAARQEIINQHLTVASKTAPALKRVEPSKPETSFLMLKLDRCHCAGLSGLECTAQRGADSDDPCGDNMPQDSSMLDDTERDIIRRWIFQGAQNN